MKNIYVGNLSYDATEDQIRSLFEAYGAVDRVSIVTDRDTGQPRGFAFVEMTRRRCGQQSHGRFERNQDGRPQSQHQRSPAQRKPSAGGGGGGRGG